MGLVAGATLFVWVWVRFGKAISVFVGDTRRRS